MAILRVMDDRDRKTVIPLRHARVWASAWWSGIGPWRVRALPKTLWRLFTTPEVVLAIAAACLIGVLIRLLVDDSSIVIGLMIFSPVMIPLLTLSLMTGRGVLGAGRGLAPRVRDSLLEQGRCAGCGYELSSIARAQDDCRVCPECGAAWILPDDRPDEVVVIPSTK